MIFTHYSLNFNEIKLQELYLNFKSAKNMGDIYKFFKSSYMLNLPIKI